MTHAAPEAFAAFVGLDWADAQHDGCLQTAHSTKRAYCQLEHTPEAMDAWVTTLRTRCSGPPVAIGLDSTKALWSLPCARMTCWSSSPSIP
jgi:hypothetical protein